MEIEMLSEKVSNIKDTPITMTSAYRSLQQRAREAREARYVRSTTEWFSLTQSASALRALLGEPEPVQPKCVRRGAGCSASGDAYEGLVTSTIQSHTYGGASFVMAPTAGSSHGVDVYAHCDAMLNNPLRIEAKSTNHNSMNPDWGQIAVKCVDGCWSVPSTSKSPEACKAVFTDAFGERVLWNGEDPLVAPMTIEQLEFERADGKWKDLYITDGVDPDSICKFYRGKGCEYIQIKGKGLYSLGTDSWGLEVPVFGCGAQVRVRVKVHKSCTPNGYARLSVTAALQPTNLAQLASSPYTLDGSGPMPQAFTGQ
jgi:hypothetical protein